MSNSEVLNNIKSKPIFRYDINALRALAVIAVTLFHYKLPYLQGGFLGVDVFFVLSGYVMTRIILNDIKDNKFSYVNFVINRAKRILPALLFVVAVITVLGFFIYFPDYYQLTEQNALASLLFLSNVLYWKTSNYFSPAANSNIFLHTWSLSVEWQFYLIYPTFLRVTSKFIKNKLHFLVFFITATLILFLCTIKITQLYSTASFYLLPTRCWEMLFGGIAFLTEDIFKEAKLRKALSIIGSVTIFISVVTFNSEMSWPGAITIIPVFATYLVLISNCNDLYIYNNKWVQFTGKISYSLYLWHWPLFVILRYYGIELNVVSTGLLIIASFVMAHISNKYVEYASVKSKRFTFISIPAFAICMLATSFVNLNNALFKSHSIDMSNYLILHGNEIKQQFNEQCFIDSKYYKANKFDKQNCLKIVPGKLNIMLIGDSHAAQLSQAFNKRFNALNINLIQVTSTQCLPFVGKNGAKTCSEIMDYTYNDFIIKNSKKIDGVMICANWIEMTNSDSTQMVSNLANTVAYLKKYKLKTIIIGQNITYTQPYPTIAARENEYGVLLSKKYINDNSLLINKRLSKKFNKIYINIIDVNYLSVSAESKLFMFDENHLTIYGANIAMSQIIANPITRRLLNLTPAM